MFSDFLPKGIPISKRIFDLLIAIFGGILVSPVLLIVAILVRFRLGKPIIFAQVRPGYGGRKFTLYKFRSMSNERDRSGTLLSDKDRITPLGRFLRATSLDELPELYNVIRGEMSLVGPRPLLEKYLDRYNREQARRHDVLPGITGWAQINGRNNISWEDKFKLDVWYVDNQSRLLDIKIMWLTLWKVLRREGINESENATSHEFLGTISDS